MKSSLSWLISLAIVVLSSLLCIITVASAASVGSSEIYESRGMKLGGGVNGGGEDLNPEKADKRTFFVGSRYGRSQSDLVNMDGKSAPRIAPRNDRYFFGSRYGKRSSGGPTLGFDEDNQALNCFYTGITNLYRCVDQSSATNDK